MAYFFFMSLFTASVLWLLWPYVYRHQSPRNTAWVRWLSHYSAVGQLLWNAGVAGSLGAVALILWRFLVEGRFAPLEGIAWMGGWIVGTLVVGGWQLRRGVFPIIRISK